MPDYQQPEFYRFNQDSLDLVRFIRDEESQAQSILDLGAGCGVIGIELARLFSPQRLALLELQREFEPFLRINAMTFLPPAVALEVSISSFTDWRPTECWDLVVANPPYYLPGHGEVARDPRRSRARCFSEGGWASLAAVLKRSLSPAGRGYLVVKNTAVLLAAAKAELRGAQLIFEVIEHGDLRIIRITN